MRSFTLSSLGVLVAIGCNSDVDVVDGSGGSGAAVSTAVGPTAGQTSSNVTTAASTAQGTTAPASSSTGTGDVCEDGCAHVAMCGFDLCAMAGVDCSNPQFDCPMQCVLGATCEELIALVSMNPPPQLAACLEACQGGMGGGGEGGAPPDCQGCIFQNDCATPCITDNQCIQGWGQCAQSCTDPACFDACDAMFPQSAAIYAQVYDCACTACEPQCGAAMAPCDTGAGGGI